MRAAGSAAVRRGALGLVVVTGVALVSGVPVPRAGAEVAPGQTLLVTRPSDGSLLEHHAVETAISGGGRHIVFSSRGSYTDLDNNGSANVFARDLDTGVTTQVSLGHEPSEGEPVYDRSPDGDSSQPAISADGRFVAFVTTATNIAVVTDGVFNDSAPDVVVLDRDADRDGRLDDSAPRYHRITASHYYDGHPRTPRLSADGRRVLWTDEASLGEFGTVWVVRHRDLLDGAPSTPIATVSPDLKDGTFPVGAYDGALSADGTHAAMVVDYSEPEPGLRHRPLLRLAGQGYADPDFTAIILVHLGTRFVSRVDYDEEGEFLGTSREAGMRFPAISADGSVVAFEAEEYQTGDGAWYPLAGQPNVYVVRRAEERSRIVSRNTAGELRNGARPALSADARYLAFVTDSPDMHDGVDRAPSDSSCLRRSDSLAVPPPDAARDARTDCQVVVRDLVLDAGPERFPGVLASPGVGTDCADVLLPDQTCAGGNDSGLAPSDLILDLSDGEGVPSLSADGSRVAFDSRADDLVPGDTNESWDGFVRTFQPAIAADPVDFGAAEVGTTLNRTATLRVVGAGPLRIASITVDGADFTPGADTCVGVALHRLGECLAGVAFTPTAPGPRAGRLVVRLADGREFGVDLRGEGSDVPVVPDGPELTVVPAPLDFGTRLLLSTEPTGTLTVTNAGGSPMTVASVVPALPSDFSVRSTDCAVVASGSSCSVLVRFRPTVAGPRVGGLIITSDAPGGPRLVGLRGVGSTPALVVNPGVSRPGRVTNVSGAGFPADTAVRVRYLESVEIATAVTSNEGAFSVPLLVFPKASIGQRTVVATVDGVLPEISAKGPLLVVYPSMSPPEFLTRG
ncbi:choice-of-anchor D domain-containing protein [Actinokineospora sp. 24-640]